MALGCFVGLSASMFMMSSPSSAKSVGNVSPGESTKKATSGFILSKAFPERLLKVDDFDILNGRAR